MLNYGKNEILLDLLGVQSHICFQLNAPPNDLITECTPTLAPEFHSFRNWAIRNELLQKNENKVFYGKLPKVYVGNIL